MNEPIFETFCGLASDLLGILDHEGRFVSASDAFEPELGWRGDDLVGRPLVSLLLEEDRPEASSRLASLVAGAESVAFTSRCPLAGGGLRTVHWRAAGDGVSGQVMVAGHLVSEADRLRSLIDYSADLIAVLDADARLIFSNPAFATTLGYPGVEWLGRSILDLILPEDRSRAEELIARVLASPDDIPAWRFRVRHAQLTWRWLEGTCTNRIADPALGGIVINCRDVTDRVEAAAKVRRSEELLRQAVRLTDIGIFDHDQVNETVYWSPRQLEIYGWDSAEEMTLADIIGMIHPDDAPRIQAAIHQAHSPDGTGVWAVDYRITRRDGALRWLTGHSQTLFEGEGEARRPVRTIGAIFDDTERRVAEEALLVKDRAIENALNGIVVTDADGVPVYANPAFARLWGYDSPEDVIEHAPVVFTDPVLERGILEQLRETGQFGGEMVARRKEGTGFEVIVSATAVKDADGKIVNLMASFLDISEMKLLQEQLMQSQKMESVGRLAGGVAHDFNNLLTVMKGYLEMALLELRPDAPLRRDLGEVARAADSAARLTQQLLAFSRKQIIDPQALDLNDVIGSVEKMLRRLLGEDIVLLTKPAEDLWPVRFDLSQGEQILVNLAINARDAMPDGGKLTMETTNVSLGAESAGDHRDWEPGDYVMLTVSDSGAGMSDETKTHLFEPFYTTKEPGQGTGLGLSMVYGAVSQNGGRIEVSSEPGQGTTFKIYLQRMAIEEAASSARPVSSIPHGTETIVLVEDDDSVRYLATRQLRQLGYTVHVFADGTSALAAVDQMSERVHLLVSDVIMPEMNGLALAEALKAERPDIKVLFMSGYTDNVIANHGLLEDGVDFLPKPYTVASMAQRVRAVLDRTEGSTSV